MNNLAEAVANLVDSALTVHVPDNLEALDPRNPLDVLGFCTWWVTSYGLDRDPEPTVMAARDHYLEVAKADTARRRQAETN